MAIAPHTNGRGEPQPFHPDEPGAVSASDINSYLGISSFPDWPAVGRAFCERAESQAKVTPEIAALAENITRGQASRRDQAQAIFDWIAANIRYVSISLGSGGLVPRSVQSIVANRYGDCKDHSTLMLALLAAKGIDAEYALININSSYRSLQTPVLSFDHVIAYIPEFNLYSDPTANRTSFGMLPSVLHDKPVLRCARGNSTSSRTPPAVAEANAVTVETQVTVHQDGSASGTAVTTAHGASAGALREFVASTEEKGGEEKVKEIFNSFQVRGTGGMESPPSTDLANPYSVKTTFKLEDNYLGEDNARRVMAGPRVLGTTYLNMTSIFHGVRHDDFVCFPASYRENVVYHLPSGWTANDLPQDVTVAKGPAEFRARYTARGDTVEMERVFSLRTTGSVCSAAMAREMAPVFKAASRDREERLTFVPVDDSAKIAPTVPPAVKAADSSQRPPSTHSGRTSYTVRAGNLVDRTITAETLIETLAAAEKEAQLSVPVNERTETLQIVEAATLKANGRKLAVSADKIISQSKANIITRNVENTDNTMRTIIFPDVAVGDRLYAVVKYTAKAEDTYGGFHISVGASASYSFRAYSLSVDAPADLKLRIAAKGFVHKQSENNGRVVHDWTMEPLPYRPEANEVFRASEDDAYVRVSSYPDWPSAARSFCERAEPMAAVTPEIARLADEITQGQASRADQARAIYGWVVANIRDIGAAVDFGGWIPDAPASTVAKRYGDQKAQAALMRALLAAKGIESEYGLRVFQSTPKLPETVLTPIFAVCSFTFQNLTFITTQLIMMQILAYCPCLTTDIQYCGAGLEK